MNEQDKPIEQIVEETEIKPVKIDEYEYDMIVLATLNYHVDKIEELRNLLREKEMAKNYDGKKIEFFKQGSAVSYIVKDIQVGFKQNEQGDEE